jgi:catechol 2,3-dioxygenase-like lactoylglutathione lyase family enzyme
MNRIFSIHYKYVGKYSILRIRDFMAQVMVRNGEKEFAMDVKSFHHVAYRCKDAKETADFYTNIVGLPYTMAVAEDKQPTTGEDDPYMHIFFQLEDGSFLAFFELPGADPMGRDENTPEWVQHIAFNVGDIATLNKKKAQLEANGIEYLGPTDHTICQSIYFFDPNGHRLEYLVDTTNDKMTKDLADAAKPMLEEWTATKRAPRHADWVHKNSNN